MERNSECNSCFWWEPGIPNETGLCHRNPPKDANGFIETHCYDWCGEFKFVVLRSEIIAVNGVEDEKSEVH